MANSLFRTFCYAFAWLLVVLLCLHAAHGDPTDDIVTAIGFALVHVACANLIIVSHAKLRVTLLAIYAVLSAMLLSVLLIHYAFIKSGGVLDADAVRAIAQTNVPEMLAYLRNIVSPLDTIAAASVAVLLAAAFPRKRYSLGFLPGAAVAIVAVIGVGMANAGSMAILVPIRLTIQQYHDEMDRFHTVLAQRKATQISGANSSFEGTAVVIIGESTSRRHMSRYGYFRPTTPSMDARGDSLIAFTDVISAHSHTVPALAAALTSAGSSPATDFFSPGSIDIVSLARGAGFNTSWLSNQNEFGIWDNPVAAMAKQTDDPRYLSSEVGKTFRRSHFDHELLQWLHGKLEKPAGRRNLVAVHLFTSHAPYCFNYPEEFGHFKEPLGRQYLGNAGEPADVSCYDNGIMYIDRVLEEAIKVAAASPEPVVLLYFSDHGEAPLLNTAHESSKHSSYHIEIPLLLWANQAYAQSHVEMLAQARSNMHRPYSTGRLYHSLAQLLEITHPSVSERHSLFSTNLVDLPRSAIGGTVKYDEWSAANDYRENASVNVRNLGARKKSVWAHRINSLGALSEAAATFGGIEMDVNFVGSDDCFHVYHPPAPDNFLTLSQMLAAASHRPDLQLWLDWKNATAQNIQAAIKCLDELDSRFGIRGRSLIETGSDAVFAETRLLSRAGYSHGYYLPTEAAVACMKTCDEAGRRRLASQIQATVAAGGYSAITFDWQLADFVREQLGDWAKARNLSLYSWDMSINIASNNDVGTRIEKRFATLDLTGLLVTFPSLFKI